MEDDHPDGTREDEPVVDQRLPRVSRRRVLLGLAAGAVSIAAGDLAARAPDALAADATPGASPSPAASPVPPSDLSSPPSVPLQRQVLKAENPKLLQAPVNDLQGIITPNSVHFVRNHFDTPIVDAAQWKLEIAGTVKNSISLTLDALKAMPSKVLTSFIECSGNGRAFFSPKATGAAWTNGGISVAEWTGVPLAAVLEKAGLSENTVDIVAEGGDSGRVFRAIPKAKALDPDTILAYGQNGEALSHDNGYPVRLVVPGWGGINSIKWIAKITAVDQPFEGFYNNRYYVYETPGLPKTPVQALGVKSFIARPAKDSLVPASSPAVISGFAWSGLGEIAKVEVSTDGGQSWHDAELLQPVLRWAWVRWQYAWNTPAPGNATLQSRATDKAGNVQPASVAWNRYGYGNNAIQAVSVRIG